MAQVKKKSFPSSDRRRHPLKWNLLACGSFLQDCLYEVNHAEKDCRHQALGALADNWPPSLCEAGDLPDGQERNIDHGQEVSNLSRRAGGKQANTNKHTTLETPTATLSTPLPYPCQGRRTTPTTSSPNHRRRPTSGCTTAWSTPLGPPTHKWPMVGANHRLAHAAIALGLPAPAIAGARPVTSIVSRPGIGLRPRGHSSRSGSSKASSSNSSPPVSHGQSGATAASAPMGRLSLAYGSPKNRHRSRRPIASKISLGGAQVSL